MTRLAAEQFLPCLAIGALLTAFVYRQAPSRGVDVTGTVVAAVRAGHLCLVPTVACAGDMGGTVLLGQRFCCLHWGQGDQALARGRWRCHLAAGSSSVRRFFTGIGARDGPETKVA